jgi:NTP pyrophosphatase (non-canonical NTP hydrolase)
MGFSNKEMSYMIGDAVLGMFDNQGLNIKWNALTSTGMLLNEYQELALKTAVYPGQGEILGKMYCALKLNGEAGEVAEKIGKVVRDDNMKFSPEKTLAIAKELGDTLWYISSLAKELGFSLNDIAKMNIDKLKQRKDNNKLHGEGDNR